MESDINQKSFFFTEYVRTCVRIPGLATYFCFSFRFFKKGSCQLLAKVCAQSIG